MKLNSAIDVEVTTKALVDPIYEEKAISILSKAFIRLIDIIGSLVGIIMLIPMVFLVLIEKIKTSQKGPILYTQKRIGKNGKIFRLYKLNTKAPISEFPQFINVLLGQMTLVGPRPYTTEEIPKMGEYYNVIINAKPGITGVYQISGKRTNSFRLRFTLFIKYFNCIKY